MLAPMLLVIGLIIAFCQSPTYWLVGLTLAIEICFLFMIVNKILAIMDEPDETPES
jgi:hypothetical protein